MFPAAGETFNETARIMKPHIHGAKLHDFAVKTDHSRITVKMTVIQHDRHEMMFRTGEAGLFSVYIINAFLHIVPIKRAEQIILFRKVIRKGSEFCAGGSADHLHAGVFISVFTEQFFRAADDRLFCFDSGFVHASIIGEMHTSAEKQIRKKCTTDKNRKIINIYNFRVRMYDNYRNRKCSLLYELYRRIIMEIKKISVGPVSNFYAVEENGKTMLVDTGCFLNQPGWTLKAVLSGIDLANVSLIVLTHGHFDHAGGIHHAKVLTGAPIMAHPGCETFLKTGKFTPYRPRNELGQKFYDNVAAPAPIDAPEPVDIDIPVTEETDLHPYGFSAKVIMTPGHTLDSISVVFDSGETFVGDTVLDPFEEGICSMAVLSLDDELLKESGKKLLDAGLTSAYSGHGGPFTREQVEQAYAALVDHNG